MRFRAALKLPKEHGAWAMLYVPLVVGVLVAWRIGRPVLLLTLSATLLFIARESMLGWWRSRRRGATQRGALPRMLVYLGLAGIAGAPLIIVDRLYMLIPLAAAALILLAINAEQATTREDRTIGGEVLAIGGLTMTAPAAHYVASGSWQNETVWLWALCALYFTSSVFYVKLRVNVVNPRKHQETQVAWRRCALYHGLLFAALFTLAIAHTLSLFVVAAFSPVIGRAFWSLIKPGGRLNLKRLGMLEIAYSVVFLIFITLTFKQA